MPLLDIATTQPCFRNNVCSVSSHNIFATRLVYNNEIRFVSTGNTFRIPQKASNSRIKLFRSGLMIRAVATLEKGPTKNTQTNEEQDNFGGVRMGKYEGSSTSVVVEQQSPSEEAELNEREKLRRMRISKANKGNTPWNKGRKHSPETLQRIRERTRLAMQDPKVKMKLVNLGHAQRILIAEAEKAAEVLEMAAHYSPVAQASLIETRKLISEAIRSIESIENEVAVTDGNLSPPSTELASLTADNGDCEFGALAELGERINGWHTVAPMDSGIYDLDNGGHALQGLPNGKSTALLSGTGDYDLLGDRQGVYQMISSNLSLEKEASITQPSTWTQRFDEDEANESPGDEQKLRLNKDEANAGPVDEQKPLPNGLIYGANIEVATTTTTTKKWVRGRLVEQKR